jgi:hypothetical protein
VQELYRLDKQYSPISAIASLYYLFDTIGIYHCKIYKILAYYINHIGITTAVEWTQNWKAKKLQCFFNSNDSRRHLIWQKKVSLAVGPKFNVAAPSGVRSKFGLRASKALLFPK